MTTISRAVNLHPEIAPLFTRMTGLQPPMEEREAADVRALMDGFALANQKPRPDDVVTEDLTADLPGRQIRLRVYRPKDASGPLPVMFFFHGGGWVIGNIDTHDRYVAQMTHDSRVAFVAVDYRLAPETPYPAAIHDAYDSVCWIHENARRLNLDGTRMGVSGDSAGGQLSAACTLLSRDRKGPKLSFQLLLYPLTDCDFTRKSYDSWDDLLLTTPYMKWLWKQWVGDTLPIDDPYALPLRASDLGGLPRAYVVTCEYDILRDEGELYAMRLMDAGVHTTLRRLPGSTHPFLRAMSHSEWVRREMREMGHQIRCALVDD